MGRSDKRQKATSKAKNWLIILAAIIPVWAVVMFVGWFVISTLVPMLGPEQTGQTADGAPSNAIIDFNTAAGPGDEEIMPKK